MLQTANELTTSGENLTAMVDLAIYLLKRGTSELDIREKIKRNYKKVPDINHLINYIFSAIKENAALNKLPMQEFARMLDDETEQKKLLLRRPREIPLGAKPR